MADRPEAQAGTRYANAGVDIDAGNRLVDLIRPAVRATGRPGADGSIGGFGGVFDLKAAGYADPLLVSATDGVGTKLRIAIETGRLATVGIDLVAMCVNDLVVQGAEPLFFLDYYATGRLVPEQAAEVVAGIAEGCRIAGAALVGGETAEMPGMYGDRDFDLAGFAVGAVERDNLLPRGDVAPGDVILGLASSGLHSNGFSLVRKIVTDAGLGWSDPAPFAFGATLGEALLTPTQIYVRPILDALKHPEGIKAFAHITGGGLTENLPRVLPEGTVAAIQRDAVDLPPLFAWLAETGSVATDEMFRTFNCGVGMAAIVAADIADAVEGVLVMAGETVQRIGTIGSGEGPARVRYV